MTYKDIINSTFIQKDNSVYDGIKNGILLARFGTVAKASERNVQDDEKMNAIAYMNAIIVREAFIKVTAGHRPEEFFDANTDRAEILNHIDVLDYDPAEKSFLGCETYDEVTELYKGIDRTEAPIEILTALAISVFGSRVQCEEKDLFEDTDDNLTERERLGDFNGFIMRDVYISLFGEAPENTLLRYKKDKPKDRHGFLSMFTW